MVRERTVQPKLDRSDSVLFSRVRPAIQYRSSTDRLVGGGRFPVETCRLLTAAAAAALLMATQLTELVCIIALRCVSVSLY